MRQQLLDASSSAFTFSFVPEPGQTPEREDIAFAAICPFHGAMPRQEKK
jgi:hypothetical protein